MSKLMARGSRHLLSQHMHDHIGRSTFSSFRSLSTAGLGRYRILIAYARLDHLVYEWACMHDIGMAAFAFITLPKAMNDLTITILLHQKDYIFNLVLYPT